MKTRLFHRAAAVAATALIAVSFGMPAAAMEIIGQAAQEHAIVDPERREFLEIFRSRYRGETVDR